MFLEVKSCDNIPEIVSKFNPIATKDGFILGTQPFSLMLWTDKQKKIFQTQHRSPITSLCMSLASHPYICSCSDDKVIIWNVDDFINKDIEDDGKLRTGHVVGIDLGPISDCSVNCNNTWLAVCRENDVWVVHLEHSNGTLTSVSHHTTLEPVGEPACFCCFSPCESSLLVTADDSNTFKVWDVEKGYMVQRSSVGGWHRISFCGFVMHGSHTGLFLVGTNRGTLHLYMVGLIKAPRSLTQVSAVPPVHGASTVITSTESIGEISAKPGQYDYGSVEERPATPPGDGCEAGCVILGALLVDALPESPRPHPDPDSPDESGPGPADEDDEDATVAGILASAPLLFICSNQGLAVYDSHSWDCVAFRSHAELVDKDLSLVSTAALSGRAPNRVLCLLAGWASSPSPGPTSHLVRVACGPPPPPPAGPGPGPARPNPLSFLSLTTLSARSPLRAQLSRPAADAASAAYGAASRTRSSSRRRRPAPSGHPGPASAPPAQRPVKSSGYGVAALGAQRQLFIPAVSRSREPRPWPRSACGAALPALRALLPAARPAGGAAGAAGGAGGAHGGLLSRMNGDLLRTWTPPLRQSARVSLWHDFGTAVRLASSADGASLACSCGPGVLSVLRWSRPSVDDGVRIAGHDARISSVCFSADSAWLMSASSDGRTKVWDWRERRCALDIGGEAAAVPGRSRGVAQAAFFYLDRFILRAVGGTLELYCHRLHEQPGLCAAKAGLSGARDWRRVRKIKFPTQQVTCFAAPNNFYSNVVVVGCASRSLHVYDVDAERFLAEVRDAHPRPPHALGLATASAAPAAHCARAADLVVSAAACDGAKLWDLRQARCVQKFTRHLNRAHACGVSLSPCCRYLAVGSEDKCVYLYDTRKSVDYLDKIMGLNEVVLDVTWNPYRPQLAASALNSCVGVYSTCEQSD